MRLRVETDLFKSDIFMYVIGFLLPKASKDIDITS